MLCPPSELVVVGEDEGDPDAPVPVPEAAEVVVAA